MNEEQYLQTCDACDSVLLSPEANLETIAIPWLHVIREHPVFLNEYQGLFATSTWADSLKAFPKQAWNLAGWLRQLWKALRADGEPWRSSRALTAPVDVLLVSHLLSVEDAGKAPDFYFGDLPECLLSEGRSVVVALIDHTGIPDVSLALRWEGNVSSRVLLTSSLGFRGELSLYRRLRKEASRLKTISRRENLVFLKKVYARASLEVMSGSARTTLRQSVQIGRLVAAIKPKMMILTYEGHAWERMAFDAARKAFPRVRCVGYQHAALFKMQHSALRKLGAAFDPDLVLTAGRVSKLQLEHSKKLQNIPVEIFGSNRASVPAPKARVALPEQVPVTRLVRTGDDGCLVLPEGIISECLLLFEFSLNCAELMPQMRFIWRLHPLISQKRLMRSSSRMRRLPNNVELSYRSMEDDFRRAGYALYRGSTAIVKAVCSGLKPIYLARVDEMTIDPLHELGAGRFSVTCPFELRAIICDKNQAASEAAVLNQQAAIRYCEDFYSPTDVGIILSALH